MQLALDALDRLVELLEEQGPLPAVEAARALFATPSVSEGLALSLLEEVTAGDSRVACSGSTVALATGADDPLLEDAAFVVFDLETTGLSATQSRICEIGAVRVAGLELVDEFQSLVNPGVSLPEQIARLTGLRDPELRRAPSVRTVLRRFLAFAGDDLLVAHNASFDRRFLEHQLCACTDGGSRSRRSARRRSPDGCSKAAGAGSGSPGWRTSSAFRRRPATAHSRTRRRRPRSSCT